MNNPEKSIVYSAFLQKIYNIFKECWLTRNDENPILMPKVWVEDHELMLKDLVTIFGHGWFTSYKSAWKIGELKSNNLISKCSLEIKRWVPRNGYHPDNLTVTVPLTNGEISEDSAKALASKVKAKKSEIPGILYEDDGKKLSFDLKVSDYAKAKHEAFNYITRKAPVGKEYDDMVSPTWAQMPEEAKAKSKKITFVSERIPGFVKDFDLRKYCDAMGYSFYGIIELELLKEEYSKLDVDEAAMETFAYAVKRWLKAFKKPTTKKNVAFWLDHLMALFDSMESLYPHLTRIEIVNLVIKGANTQSGTPDGLRLTKEGTLNKKLLTLLGNRRKRKECWLWKPNTGHSVKFLSIKALAQELGFSEAYARKIALEGGSTKEGYMITYSNKAPSEMKGIIEMRKLKERALNLDGPFMRSVLSPMQRDLLAYAIVDGFSLEDIALLLDLNIKVIRKLVNSAFDDRDAIEEIAAEGVGLGEDNNPVGKEYDDSERRSRRDRERRDTRRGSRNRKGEDSGVFGPY
jgi:hypothetical protein